MIVEYSLSTNEYSTITGNVTAGKKELGAAAARYDSYLEELGIDGLAVREAEPKS